MFKRTIFYGYYFLGWLLFFFITRLIFFFCNLFSIEGQNNEEFFLSFIYGLRLDISLIGYFLLPILLIGIITTLLGADAFFKSSVKVITFLYAAIACIMLLVDTLVYPHWGVRLDATIYTYLNTPMEMLASLKTYQVIIAAILYVSSVGLTYFFFLKIINQLATKKLKKDILAIVAFLILAGIGLRGGFQRIPINQSNVYFSDNQYANHLAINGIWNFGHSYLKGIHDTKNSFKIYEQTEANLIVSSRLNEIKNSRNEDKILNTETPNVIIIIWESLTSKIVAPLNGYPDVTPNFKRLCKEGLLFSNFYANGDRSDKGLVSLMSGYYPQCQRSIIKTPSKIKNLPIITSPFTQSGYNCSFYYGGDLNFGNMNAYLLSLGLSNITSGKNFDKKNWNSKWGVHDHIVLERVLEDLQKEKSKPFFKTIFTLTSHEPYEFPGEPAFKQKTEIDMFKSAHHYTDHSINQFIEQAKKEDWWENTLVIITADHGHRYPLHKGSHNAPIKFHIPMLWLGGALDSTGIIDNFGSQKDLSYTLLDELAYDNQLENYPFSKNLFSNSEKNFAHYIFNNGFGTIDKSGSLVYDYHSQKIIESKGKNLDTLKMLGQAVTQSAYQDYLNR